MQKFSIDGGRPISGTLRACGAKNAALPALAAALLGAGTTTLSNIPVVDDIEVMKEILTCAGACVTTQSDTVQVTVADLGFEVPHELAHRVRASFLLMGPLLARLGRSRVYLPGGCNIGTRPVDLHLKGLEAMGATVLRENGYVEALARRLRGADIYLDYPSVGATENLMMAATLASGETTLHNAAVEPEIEDLARLLSSMGADIEGAGTSTIRVRGVMELRACRHHVIPDRIEAGTLLIAGAATGGRVRVEGIRRDHLGPVIAKLQEAGVEVSSSEEWVEVQPSGRPRAVNLRTMPHPGFPTDLQPQFAVLMALADGISSVTETVFENRFAYAGELARMSANLRVDGRTLTLRGTQWLSGTTVYAPDLRAGAGLVLAGLAARGVTEIYGMHHVDRGYERIDERLRSLGASVRRESVDECEDDGTAVPA